MHRAMCFESQLINFQTMNHENVILIISEVLHPMVTDKHKQWSSGYSFLFLVCIAVLLTKKSSSKWKFCRQASVFPDQTHNYAISKSMACETIIFSSLYIFNMTKGLFWCPLICRHIIKVNPGCACLNVWVGEFTCDIHM